MADTTLFDRDEIKQQCKDIAQDAYGGGIIDDVKQWLDLGSGGVFADLLADNGIISTIYDCLALVGALLCVIYFIGSCIDKTSRQEFTIETFAKDAVLMIGCVAIITFGFDIVKGAADIGTGVITTIQNALNNAGEGGNSRLNTMLAEIEQEIDNQPSGLLGFKLLWYYISNYFVIGMVIRAEKALIIVASLTRSIEFVLYSMYFPIGCSDIFKNGMGSNGVRYVKKLLAIALQGAVIICVMLAANSIRDAVISNGSQGGLLYSVAIYTVSVMTIFKSAQYVNDIMGV